MKKVSIITVVYNNKECIEGCINSVLNQSYENIEYIIVDGGSTDGTIDIIERFKDKISIFISESDKGIYDALNKGVVRASGDVIAILHSDDKFCNFHVISNVINHMNALNSELCFSNIVIVDNDFQKILRYYRANHFKRWMFRTGWMPPHPSCFINKSIFNEFGLYSLNYKIAGDFDFLVRIFYSRDINWGYLNRITVKMRQGGVSNDGFSSKRVIAREINQSLRENNVWSLPIFQLGRYAIRLLELLIKPRFRHHD